MDAVRFAEIANGSFHVAWKDGERVFCRGWHKESDGSLVAVLAVRPCSEHPHPATLDRFTHEYGLKDKLDGAWAARPLELIREGGRNILVLEAPGGEPLEHFLGRPMEIARFLRLGISLSAALRRLHEHGLVHKDIRPANVLVNSAGELRLTGFGIASRLPRERQPPDPPQIIGGT